jgi:hypothetical protein
MLKNVYLYNILITMEVINKDELIWRLRILHTKETRIARRVNLNRLGM